MANLSAQHIAIELMIKQFGSAVTLTKADGSLVKTTGVALSAEAKDDSKTSLSDYQSYTSKNVYISGKTKLVPEQGDTVTMSPNIYTVIAVKALAVGEGAKNVFAYKLTVGV